MSKNGAVMEEHNTLRGMWCMRCVICMMTSQRRVLYDHEHMEQCVMSWKKSVWQVWKHNPHLYFVCVRVFWTMHNEHTLLSLNLCWIISVLLTSLFGWYSTVIQRHRLLWNVKHGANVALSLIGLMVCLVLGVFVFWTAVACINVNRYSMSFKVLVNSED